MPLHLVLTIAAGVMDALVGVLVLAFGSDSNAVFLRALETARSQDELLCNQWYNSPPQTRRPGK